MYKQIQFPTDQPQFNNICFFSAPTSFQKEFSFDEKDNPAKSAKDIDVCIAANLPKGQLFGFFPHFQ